MEFTDSTNSLLNCLQNFIIELQTKQICQKIIILLGDSKAGKTTLLYYLTGKELQWVEDTATMIHSMKAAHVQQNAVICDTISTTTYPNIWSDQQKQWTIIDFPGFNDDRNLNKLLNIFIFEKIFQKLKKVHFCFVIPNQSLDGQELLKCMGQFNKLISNKFIQKSEAFSVILTKTQDDEETVKQSFFQILEQLKEQQKQIQEFVQILLGNRNNIFTFANDQPNAALGVQILKTIVQERQFKKSQNLNAMLHEKYIQTIIGDHKNQTFETYLVSLVDGMGQIFQSVLKLVQYLFRHYYKKTLSEIQQQNIQLYDKKQYILILAQNLFKNDETSLKIISTQLNNRQSLNNQKQILQQVIKRLQNSFQQTNKNNNENSHWQKMKHLIALLDYEGSPFKRICYYLNDNTTALMQIVLTFILRISQSHQVSQKKVFLKERLQLMEKQTFENIIIWKYFNKSSIKKSSQNQQILLQVQVQPVAKTRRQQVQEELNKLQNYIQKEYLQSISKNFKAQPEYIQKEQLKITKQAIQILNSCLLQYKKQNSLKTPNQKQKLYKNLTKCTKLRDYQFLQFFLQNFITLLQIFNQFDRWNLFKSILQKKICLSLIKFNLLQEAISFAMVVPNVKIIEDAMERNCKVHKLSKSFIDQFLIPFSIKMRSKSILIKAYNQLNCNFASDRISSDGKSNNYQQNLKKLKQRLYQKQDLKTKQEDDKLKNINLIYLQKLSIKGILSKLKLINQRNGNCKSIYTFKKIEADMCTKIPSGQQNRQGMKGK